MGTVFLLTGLLAGEVQGFTRKITLLQQFFTPAGVFGHAVQRRLQSQPGFTDLLQFVAALAFEFFQIFADALTAGVDLLQAHLTRRPLRLEFALLTTGASQRLLQRITFKLQATQRFTQLIDLLLPRLQRGLLLIQAGLQLLHLLLTGQHAGFTGLTTAEPQPVGTHPMAFAGNKGFVRGQDRARAQRLRQTFCRANAGQPGAQVQTAADLVQQAARCADRLAAALQQAQAALFETGQRGIQLIKIIQRDGLQIIRQYRLDRTLPATLDLQLLGQQAMALYALACQPVTDVAALGQGCLLQRFKRSQTATATLQFTAVNILFLLQGVQCLAILLQAFTDVGELHLIRFAAQLQLGQLFGQFGQFVIQRAGVQPAALVLQTLDALAEPLDRLLHVANARLLHLGLLTRFSRALVELVPSALPVLHGVFGALQRDGDVFFGGAGHLQLGFNAIEFRLQVCQQGFVLGQMALRFLPGLLGFFNVAVQLTLTITVELQNLLDAADIGTDAVILGLYPVEGLGQVAVLITLFFDLTVGVALFGNQRLQRHLKVAYPVLTLAHLLVQRLPAQRLQLCLELPLFSLVFLVLLGRLRLPMQMRELAFQLLAQIGQARQVLVGAANAVFGLAAAILVAGDTGGFFDKQPQVFRFGFDQAGNHALLDDRVAARPEAGAHEDIGNVAAAALGAVEEILVLRFAGDLAANGYLVVTGVFALQSAVTVVEHQLDRRLADRFARVGTVEDDVGHRLATQVLGRTFAHDPAHRVDDIGLATAVRPDHRAHVGREVDRRWINEGFEAGQLDALESH